MSTETYLAFDLGAESGRALLGRLDGKGRLSVEEILRFPNGPVRLGGHLHWDVPGLHRSILEGIRRAADAGPVSIGVDTWGVDFGLLDRDGELLGNPFAYRDARTRGADEAFFERMTRRRLYELTGIQHLPFNTVFQLFAMVRGDAPLLSRAADLLFIPDLFHYFLTGRKATEFTFATTSQLFSPTARRWEEEILRAVGVDRALLQDVVEPGTVLGELDARVQKETGAGRAVVTAVATHDTGSAVAAVPASGEDFAYISSGTWSLVGVESHKPVMGREAQEADVTNEGGVGNTFRVLKNVMGLWLLQECRRVWAGGQDLSYEELGRMAENAPPFAALVDPGLGAFLTPPDMPGALTEALRKTGQPVPPTRGGMVRCILESLALAYRRVLEQVCRVTGKRPAVLHVIGGGSRNALLCRLTADATGLPVRAGPAEATAVGNLLVQAMALGRISSLGELREVVRNSFSMVTYEPGPGAPWDEAYEKFLRLGRES
jgi:rhamnulokinase